MKKLIVALALVGGVTAVAFGSLQHQKSHKQAVEKKMEKKKKCCRHFCPFS
jgi:hypothetical protein